MMLGELSPPSHLIAYAVVVSVILLFRLAMIYFSVLACGFGR